LKILIVNAGDVGHCIELVTAMQKQLSEGIDVVDTLTPFPASFQSEKDEHFYVPSSCDLNLDDKFKFISKFICYKKNIYDLIVFFTFDELLSLTEDSLLYLKESLGQVMITGIYYSSSYWRIEDKRGWCSYRESKLIDFNIPFVFSPDPLIEHLCLDDERAKLKFKWLPDFTTNYVDQSCNSLINNINYQKGSRQVVGLLGSLGKWKGVYELVSCIYQNQQLLDDYLFILSGELVEATFTKIEFNNLQEWLYELDGKIIHNNNKIETEAGFNMLVSCCDIIYSVYSNPQSSGLISKAIRFNKPILYPNDGFIPDLMNMLDYYGEEVNVRNITPALIINKISLLSSRAKKISKETLRYAELLMPCNSAELFVQQVSQHAFLNKLIGSRGVIVEGNIDSLVYSYNFFRLEIMKQYKKEGENT